jgi:hypothetical protein
MNADSPALKWDIATYKRLDQIARNHPDLCERIEFVDVYEQRVPKETIPWHHITGDVSATALNVECPHSP